MDLKLDGNGDVIFSNGDTVVISEAGANVAQRLYIMLRTFAGEWYLNIEHGIPYFQSILGQKTTKQAIDLIFQQKILAELGVQEIVEFNSNLTTDRKYSMNFKVRVDNLVVEVTNIEVGV
jgi:hypothetical protein